MKQYIKVLLVIATLITVAPFIPQASAQSATAMPARTQIMWGVGYGTAPTDFNPYSSAPAYGVAFMYEPLFGMNYAPQYGTGALIPDLGKSLAWSTDGMNLTVLLQPLAKWSDGSQVTATDVVYSYTLAANNATSNFATGANAIWSRIASITAVNATEVNFGMQPGCSFDQLVMTWMTTNVNIVPQAVWSQIMTQLTTNGQNFVNFQNNWLNTTMVPTSWQVCSGPYVPYAIAADGSYELYQKQSNWWGNGIIDLDLPVTGGNIALAPDYIGCRHFSANSAQDTSFITGASDWYAGYYNEIWNVFASYPTVNTWYGQHAPYMQDEGAPMTIMFNLGCYPFNCTWLRQAMAEFINYDNASALYASGYLSQIPLGYVTPNVATVAGAYNASIYALPMPGVTDSLAHGINMVIPSTGNASAGMLILGQHCTWNATQGAWQVTDGSVPAGYTATNGLYFLGVSPLLNVSTNAVVSLGGAADAYGPFNIMCEQGWSDVDGESQCAAQSISAAGIPVAFRQEAFYQPWATDIANNNFSMVGYGQGGQTAFGNSLVQVMAGFIGTKNAWGPNATGWVGTQATKFAADYKVLETTDPISNKAVYLSTASDMQYQLATSLPSIPMFVNGYWYGFNSLYWIGWASQYAFYQQVCAQYETTNECLKVREVLDLQTTNPNGQGGATSSGIAGFPVFFVLLAAIAPVAVIMARFRKNALAQ